MAAAGLGLLTRLRPTSGYLLGVLPALVLVGIGMGAVFPPAFQLAIRGVPPADAGVASALANVATQVGSSIGTAVLNTIAVSATGAYWRSSGRVADSMRRHSYTATSRPSAGPPHCWWLQPSPFWRSSTPRPGMAQAAR